MSTDLQQKSRNLRRGLGLALPMIALLLVFASSAAAADFTWLGMTDTNWGTDTNWAPNGVPGSAVGDTAVFDSNGTRTTVTGSTSLTNGVAITVLRTSDWIFDVVINGGANTTLVKDNTSTLTLTGANTYTGLTTVRPYGAGPMSTLKLACLTGPAIHGDVLLGADVPNSLSHLDMGAANQFGPNSVITIGAGNSSQSCFF
jgi:autotransporter-associated beta strand protein